MSLNTDKEADVKIFIARQPIFDRDKNVYAYELLYRSDPINRAYIGDNSYATLKVVANSLLIGLKQLTGGKKAFIHFNWRLLLGKIPLLFPKDLLGVEIHDIPNVDRDIMKVCSEIKRSGYLMVLDDCILLEEYQPLLPFAGMIKIDFHNSTMEKRQKLVQIAINQGIPLAAEKIETRAHFEEALEKGYLYFQGFYFQRPDVVSRREMPGYKVTYLNMLKKLYDPVLEIDELEEIIKRDVSLAYKLLRFINSASHGFRVSIRSVHHALLLLGKREVKKWLTIIVMSGIGKENPPEILYITIIRARFCELIAQEFKLHNEPSDFFLMGLFSMMDVLLSRPLDEILDELPLEETVKDALLGEAGLLKDVLEVVITFEKALWDNVSHLVNKLTLDEEKLALLYVEAVGWAKFLEE